MACRVLLGLSKRCVNLRSPKGIQSELAGFKSLHWPLQINQRSSQGIVKSDQEKTEAQSSLAPLAERVVEDVNFQIENQSHGRLFAVIYIFGHQFKVTAEDLILVNTNQVFPDVGQKIIMEKVLCVGSKDFTLVGQPLLSNVKVEATVVEKTLSYNKIWFSYMRRKNVRKLRVVQEFQTVLRINNITVEKRLNHEDRSSSV